MCSLLDRTPPEDLDNVDAADKDEGCCEANAVGWKIESEERSKGVYVGRELLDSVRGGGFQAKESSGAGGF